MSCYFRHMKDIFEEAGIEVTQKNKKEIDKVIHSIVDVEYKNCSPSWKAVKTHIKEDENKRKRFIDKVRKQIKSL